MIFNTCFNNQSYHGYKSSALKSGICKYARRSEDEKLEWCVMELARFQDIVPENTRAKAIISNLISRLRILLMEDIHPLEAERCSVCIDILERYDQNRENRSLLRSFCEVLKGCKRGRITSYHNKWYHHEKDSDTIEELELKEVLHYKKSGDSDEFLNLGENLIRSLKEGNEKFLSIYFKLLQSGHQGRRYSRKDGVYLWWEIFETLVKDHKILKNIWSLAFHEFKRKSLTERFNFGVWIGLVYWKRDSLIPMNFSPQMIDKDCKDYYQTMNKLKLDDYVVNDFHVNKRNGMAKFAIEGAFVLAEDLSAFENSIKYKEYYIQDKISIDAQKYAQTSVKRLTYRGKEYYVMKDEQPEFISWSNFTDVQVLEDGVCGGKVCCISVMYNDKKYILKEMKESMNYGKDYLLVDRCKKYFGLKDMNMKRIFSDKGQVKIDTSKQSYVGNVRIEDKYCVYCMMDYWENVGDLGKNKLFLEDPKVKKECLTIRLFDGIFRSSDNILRNILVNDKGELLSIDEGDIFGKRHTIFNKHDWCKKNCSEELFQEVLQELMHQKHRKIVQISKEMIRLNLYSREFFHRFNHYQSIVDNE